MCRQQTHQPKGGLNTVFIVVTVRVCFNTTTTLLFVNTSWNAERDPKADTRMRVGSRKVQSKLGRRRRNTSSLPEQYVQLCVAILIVCSGLFLDIISQGTCTIFTMNQYLTVYVQLLPPYRYFYKKIKNFNHFKIQFLKIVRKNEIKNKK